MGGASVRRGARNAVHRRRPAHGLHRQEQRGQGHEAGNHVKRHQRSGRRQRRRANRSAQSRRSHPCPGIAKLTIRQPHQKQTPSGFHGIHLAFVFVSLFPVARAAGNITSCCCPPGWDQPLFPVEQAPERKAILYRLSRTGAADPTYGATFGPESAMDFFSGSR